MVFVGGGVTDWFFKIGNTSVSSASLGRTHVYALVEGHQVAASQVFEVELLAPSFARRTRRFRLFVIALWRILFLHHPPLMVHKDNPASRAER